MSLSREIFYFSTLQGVASKSEPTRMYYGKVTRIPRSDAPQDPHTQALLRQDVAATLNEEALELAVPGGEPDPTGIVERYEAFDFETGDMLIFWRIPYREKKEAVH